MQGDQVQPPISEYRRSSLDKSDSQYQSQYSKPDDTSDQNPHKLNAQ